jgi:hypothetical protein
LSVVGNRLFVAAGPGKIAVYDAPSGELREVPVDVRDIFTMAAG